MSLAGDRMMRRSRKLRLMGVALIVVGSAIYTPALTETTKKKKKSNEASWSLPARTALCKADCAPTGAHGMNRAYGPYKFPEVEATEFRSKAGQKMYADCIKACLGPLPVFYLQRAFLEVQGHVFGKTATSCLDCHSKGPNLPAR